MDKKDIENKATELMNRVGGKIFAFPINETDPLSKYAVAIFTGKGFRVYPEALGIEEAAAGIRATLEGFKSQGWDSNYERNVRFVSYEAQINGPSVTMRRLRKLEGSNTPVFQSGVDVTPKEDDEGYLISARGLLKFSCLEMLEKNPKGIQFMDEYYKLLAMRKYGKTAAAIRQEVRRMSKDETIRWIENTYKNYIRDDMEVMNIMNGLKGVTN